MLQAQDCHCNLHPNGFNPSVDAKLFIVVFIAAVSFLRQNPFFLGQEKPPQRRLGAGFIYLDKDLHKPESTDIGSRDSK